MDHLALKTYSQKENILKRKETELCALKRRRAKPLKLRDLPPPDAKCNFSNNSLHVFEDSFDKLRKGEIFTKVNYKRSNEVDGSRGASSENTSSPLQTRAMRCKSSSVGQPKTNAPVPTRDYPMPKLVINTPNSITIKTSIHEHRTRSKRDKESVLSPSMQQQTKDTLDKSVSSSLWIEKESFLKANNISPSLSFPSMEQASKMEESFIEFSLSKMCNSTPIVPRPALPIRRQIVHSNPVREDSSLVEKSYAEIEKWNHEFPANELSQGGHTRQTPSLSISARKVCKMRSDSRKPCKKHSANCSHQSATEWNVHNDRKLQITPRVILTNVLDMIGIHSSLTFDARHIRVDLSRGSNKVVDESSLREHLVQQEIQKTVRDITASRRNYRRRAMVFHAPADEETSPSSPDCTGFQTTDEETSPCAQMTDRAIERESVLEESVRSFNTSCILIVTSDEEECARGNISVVEINETEIDEPAPACSLSRLSNADSSELVCNIFQEHSYSSAITTPKATCNAAPPLGEVEVKKEGDAGLFLKPGKLWRRSLFTARRETITRRRESCAQNLLCCSPARNWRLSVKFKGTDDRRNFLLENFLHQVTGYGATHERKHHVEDERPRPEPPVRESSPPFSVAYDESVTYLDAPTRPPNSKEIVLKRCAQTEPLPFDECYPEALLEKCFKVGEGVYGEVFLLKEGVRSSTILKVIPVEGTLIVSGERQKRFDEILSEMIIATELSKLRDNDDNNTTAFSEVKRIRCVQGRYPQRLLELWELYEENKGSENDSPEMFPDDQLYIVLELANGGQDAESYKFSNAAQAYSLFQQTAVALAVAESALEFEHRDLHWGNLLITARSNTKKIQFNLNGRTLVLPSRGIEVSIIDFTLSRIEFGGVTIFNDLSKDPDLFTATGDYQFDIYRLMQKHNRNQWEQFTPYSNVLWMHYLLSKMINGFRYRLNTTKLHRNYITKLEKIRNTILACKHMRDVVGLYFETDTDYDEC